MTEKHSERSSKDETRYRVLSSFSTRAEPDPACDRWVTYEPGETHQAHVFPEHVKIADLVASGHLEAVGEESD